MTFYKKTGFTRDRIIITINNISGFIMKGIYEIILYKHRFYHTKIFFLKIINKYKEKFS